MTNENNLNIDFDNKKVTDDIKKEMKKANIIHIHKTSEEGKEVDVDIDKNKKTVNININKDGEKKNVKIGFLGIKVKDDEKSINIPFWPIYIFIALAICGFIFLIYRIVE